MKNKQIIPLFIFLLILFLGIYSYLVGTPKVIKSGLGSLVYPVLIMQNYYSSADQEGNFSQALIDRLSAENLQLKSDLIKYKSLYNDLPVIGELQNFAQRYNYPGSSIQVLGQVILKNFDTEQQFILVDAGENKKIEPEMVAVYKNYLVGKVVEVYKYFSKIMLITDKSCKVSAYCLNTGVKGIHTGLGLQSFTELSFVNHLDKVELNDLVVSTGDGTIFPRGFGLGQIVLCNQEGFTYKIEVKPFVDFDSLEFCYLIQKGASILELPDNSQAFQSPN